MNRLKIYVGIGGRWVLCEKFPDDEDHAGLHEILDELVNEDVELELDQGFYLASFYINQDFKFDPLKDQSDSYLDFLEEFEEIKDYK